MQDRFIDFFICIFL